MPALAPAVVLALATRWGAPVAPRQILAQARVESGLDPLAIHDDVTGRVYHPANLAQALRIATHCETDGHDIDAGLLQINSGNFPWLHLSLAEAFDPVQSIRAGARVLTAISQYNTGSPTRGFTNGYVQRVLSRERGKPSRDRVAAAQPHTRSAADPYNDLINALIQPATATQPKATSAGHADRLITPHHGTAARAADTGLTDPLIHPRTAPPAPIALTKETSDG